MKADGTCMICDFGFALQVSGSKYFVNGTEGQAEADSLTEVRAYWVGIINVHNFQLFSCY